MTALLHWYAKNGRHDLPWRQTDDPYHIYISEIMLQQTQVKTVLERYYFPFLEAFPTLQALAAANLDDVLKQWAGLGYYNRAKNLHLTAKAAAPKLPKSIEELLKLPGIGQNTAHAIAAFAYKQPVPVMEANVKRILCRVFQLKTPTPKQLWEKAEALLDKKDPYDHNQAMMDIGAIVCTARAPLCVQCPLANICKGQNEPEQYPHKSKKSVPHKDAYLTINLDGNYAMQKREGRFLHGLWGFVLETDAPEHEIVSTVSQTYSHFRQNVHFYEAPLQPNNYSILTLQEIEKLTLSGLDKKILIFLSNYLRNI